MAEAEGSPAVPRAFSSSFSFSLAAGRGRAGRRGSAGPAAGTGRALRREEAAGGETKGLPHAGHDCGLRRCSGESGSARYPCVAPHTALLPYC